MLKPKQIILILLLGLSFSISMALPYMRNVFYDVLMESTGATHEQLGILMTIYTVVNMILYIPGGILADKFSARKIITVSLIGTGLLNILFAFNINLAFAQITWGLLSVTSVFAYWAALIKAVRDCGNSDEQGKMYGLFYGATGVWSTLIALLGTAIFSHFSSQVMGFQGVVIAQGVIAIANALLIYFLMEDNKPVTDDGQKLTIKDSLAVMKMPAVWLMIILVFSGYGVYIGISYFTPYSTKVLGMSVSTAAIMAAIRGYGLRFFSGPIGGFIADRTGSMSRVLMVCFILIASLIFTIFGLPAGSASTGVMIVLTLLFGFFSLCVYTLMYACMEEANIPPHATGTAVGVIGILGYLPDGLFPPLFGNWLDTYGADGYQTIFYFLAAMCAVGAASSYGLYRISSKAKKAAVLQGIPAESAA